MSQVHNRQAQHQRNDQYSRKYVELEARQYKHPALKIELDRWALSIGWTPEEIAATEYETSEAAFIERQRQWLEKRSELEALGYAGGEPDTALWIEGKRWMLEEQGWSYNEVYSFLPAPPPNGRADAGRGLNQVVSSRYSSDPNVTDVDTAEQPTKPSPKRRHLFTKLQQLYWEIYDRTGEEPAQESILPHVGDISIDTLQRACRENGRWPPPRPE